MGILLRLFLTLIFFFLAAVFEGTPFRYVFAIIGFLTFRGIFERPKPAAEQPRESSPSEARPAALAGDEVDQSDAIPVSDADFVEIEPPPCRNQDLSVPPPAVTRYGRVGWAIGCFGFLALIAIGIGHIKTSEDESASQDDHFNEMDEFQDGFEADKPEESSLASRLLSDAWNQSACLDERYQILRLGPEMLPPGITSNPGWQRGEYLAGVSCAFGWNDDQVARQVEILRSHGLLAIQWNAETIAKSREILEDQANLPPELQAMTPDKVPEDLGYRFQPIKGPHPGGPEVYGY